MAREGWGDYSAGKMLAVQTKTIKHKVQFKETTAKTDNNPNVRPVETWLLGFVGRSA